MLNKLRPHGLRARFLLTLLFVVGVGVLVTAVFARQGAADIFYKFVDSSAARDQQLVVTFLRDASHSGQLDQAQIEQLGRNFDVPIMLVSAAGDVLAASDPQSIGFVVALPPPEVAPQVIYQAVPAYVAFNTPVEGNHVQWIASAPPAAGITMIGPGSTPNALPLTIYSIDQMFILSATLAFGIAAVLSIGLSRQIIRPVEALTAAAQRMEKGDLIQRVAVNSRDEIGDLAQAFNSMADGLHRADQLRRDMVSDVAHELRTPLANVRGYLEAIRDGLVQPDKSVIESLHEETMLINRLIDDLQELALAEAGQLKLNRRPTSIPDLIGRVIAAARPQAVGRGLALRAALPPALPVINIDADRIGQALRNLLANAIAHTPPGGEIIISATIDETQITISMRDTGEGIAPEHLPFVFERFYRADKSRARTTGGSGLGLAIVKQWIVAHKGEVRVESELGRGSVFIVTLARGEHT